MRPRVSYIGRLVWQNLVRLGKEDGPTATEYAAMLALILMACFAAIGAFGQALGSLYSSCVDKIPTAT